MSKGKCHSRGARMNIMKANERNLRRKVRKQAAYDRQAYDKPCGEEQ